MSSIPQRLINLVEAGERLAAQCSGSLTPTLIAVPLADDPNEKAITIPIHSLLTPSKQSEGEWVLRPASLREQPQFLISSDGKVSPYNRNLDWLDDVSTTIDVLGSQRRFHLFAWTSFPPVMSEHGWHCWAELASKAGPVLQSDPQSHLHKIRLHTQVLLVFVFRTIFGTEFVEQRDGYLEVMNLWGATLFALRSTSPQRESTALTLNEISLIDTSQRKSKGRGPKSKPMTDREEKLLSMYDKGFGSEFKTYCDLAEAAGEKWDAVSAERFIRKIKRRRERDSRPKN